MAAEILNGISAHRLVLDLETINVSFFRLDQTPKEIASLEALLSSEEVQRAKRFKFSKDHDRFIARHGILRILLSSFTGFEISNLEIKKEENGKPFLSGQNTQNAIHFNISASDYIAAYCFSKIKGIGIDIEKIRDIPDMMDIVASNYTEREAFKIAHCEEGKRLDMFYKIWTRKEAVLKAQGVGLLVPLNSVDVSLSLDQEKTTKIKISNDNKSAPIWVKQINCESGYRAAIAAKRDFKIVTVTECATGFGGYPHAHKEV